MESQIDAGGSQAVLRATNLLSLVSQSDKNGSSLAELVRASGLKQPTARRLLVALMRAGLIEQSEETRRYHLGVSVYVYGNIAAERFASHSLADGAVRRLAEKTGDTAFFAIRQGLNSLCLRREEGEHPIRSHVLNVGMRHPLGVAAHGIAMLASLEDNEVEAIIAANLDYYASHYPMLTEERLREVIADARARGYSVNPGLFHEGAWAVGIAIRNEAREVIGALSVGAVDIRLRSKRQEEVGEMLKAEAKSLESRIARFDSRLRASVPGSPG